ncbi:hypothetical protein ABEX84_21410 [Bacillus subtilis]|uniref:hypothetical protein n=1 Tax=Bacillus subtilis TaxID=1423 RepID=UPI002DBBFEF6|nr:hypothetical protein [Bacillus subtilis]MEC3696420.1 hypothetical protein [Bacillus subtilis]
MTFVFKGVSPIAKKKRLKKKQQKKQNIAALKKVGVTDKKIIKELKNKPAVVSKIVKKETRNKIARERSELIKSLGFKVKDHSAKRYWDKERFDAWYQSELRKIKRREQARKRYRERKNQKKLLIYWYEKTRDYHDYDEIMRFKRSYKYVATEFLIEGIREAYSSDKGTLIGSGAVIATDDVSATKNFYSNWYDGTFAAHNGWFLIYEGVASMRKYRELLISLLVMFELMYEDTEKTLFWEAFKRELMEVNERTARRLIQDVDLDY